MDRATAKSVQTQFGEQDASSAGAAEHPLWRAYLARPPHEKEIVKLSALIGPPISPNQFLEVVRAAGMHGPGREPWRGETIKQIRSTLTKIGLLHPTHGCAPEIAHSVTVDVVEGKNGKKLVAAVRARAARNLEKLRQLSRYDRFLGYASGPNVLEDADMTQLLRLAVYTNDVSEFLKLADVYMQGDWGDDRYEIEYDDEDDDDREVDVEGLGLLNSQLSALPADQTWIASRKPAIRVAVEQAFIDSQLACGSRLNDVERIVARCAETAPQLAHPSINKLLLRRAVLRADFHQAQSRMKALPSEDACLAAAHKASIDFLTGKNDKALTGFDDALKQRRKILGRGARPLDDEAGVFHLLALLGSGDRATVQEIGKFLKRIGYPFSVFEYHDSFAAIEALFQLVSGQDAQAVSYAAALSVRWPGAGLDSAIAALAQMHIDVDASRRRASENAAECERLAPHLPLIARIYADVLRKTSNDEAFWTKRAAELCGGDVIDFSKIVEVKPSWERAFENMTAFLEDKAAGGGQGKSQAAKAKRLAWLVNLATKEVEAVEQTAKSAGWTAGRALSFKRLHEAPAAADYITAHDQRALACVRKERLWNGDYRVLLDSRRALLALVGHPCVFNAEQRDQQVELVAYPVELVVRDTPNGYNFNLSHRGTTPCVFLEEEAPGRWRVIELTEQLIRFQEALGQYGVTVPIEMRDRVAAVLKRDNPLVPIRSELPDLDAPAIEGDATPVLQLQRLANGLKVNVVIRPFGAEGPFYLPGQGGRSILVARNGASQRANRDLDTEKQQADALLAACPSLGPWQVSPHEWRIEALEDALEFLVEAQSFEQPVTFEWPEGDALKVSRQVTGRTLSLKLAHKRDWFEVSGEVEVDEDLVLDMKDLLGRLDRAKGRFIPLDGGRFVVLAQDFQRQLGRLERVSEETAGGRRLHGLASLAVEELVESAGKVHADKHWRELNKRIQAAGRHTPSVPASLQTELRDYQMDGFVWLSRLANLQMGACLADDMGLGKTIQTIAVMIEQQPNGACLVVAPTSVCHNWEKELARFAPTLTAHRLAAAPDRDALIERMGPGDVLIASYGLLHQEDEKLTGRAWNMVVFDEAQNLKNGNTKRAKASQNLEARFRVALSGTPIENYLEELWSLFNTINPGLLGSRESFQRRFSGPIERERNASARDSLRALIRPFILRRTKAAVLDELPPRTELTIPIKQSEEERAFYEAVRLRAMESIANMDDAPGQRKLRILAEITKLRRACCHPALIDPDTALESAKLAAFVELIDELLRNRHKALVFSQFLGHLEKVREALEARGVRYQYIDGSTPAQQRADRVAAFQKGEGDLFLISLKAGGTGLNLTAADYVIHLDPWWNPAVEDQASDRAHRIGQSRPVTVYRLVVEDSIEERILELHKHKRDLAADLLDGAEVSGRLSEDELIALIRT